MQQTIVETKIIEVGILIMTSNITARSRKKNNLMKNIYKHRLLLMLAMPAVLKIFFFCYVPMLGNIMAFQKFSITKGFFESPFVGFDNFIKVFSMPSFFFAIKNTLIFSSVLLIFSFPMPIILALMYNELKNKHFKKVVQTVSYLPYFLSWISVIAMFYSLFSVDGVFNDFRQMVFGPNVERTNILMDSKYFLGILYTSSIWKNIGWNSVIFVASITGIDQQLYEAAQVDGCSKFGQVLHITLPSIMPTIVIVFVMSMGSLVSVNFEQVFGFQNLFTQEQTEVINTIVYRAGLLNAKYSEATAFGLSQGLVSLFLVITSNKLAVKFFKIGLW
jgi:putative aldouronate transport system permease protein